MEHTCPQSWWNSQGEESDEGRIHDLGNLLLLAPVLNFTLQDNRALKEVDADTKTGLLIAQDVAETVSISVWNFKIMKGRETHLLEWAMQERSD